MNILRLVYEWSPPWDGLTPGPYELTCAQLKLGHEVVVFCGGGFKNLGKISCSRGACPAMYQTVHGPVPDKGDACVAATIRLEGASSEDVVGLCVYRFPRALKRFSLFLTTAPAVLLGYLWLRLIRRGPNLVHGHGHITLWFNLYKLLFGWLDKTPYVLHLHITAAGRENRLQSLWRERQRPIESLGGRGDSIPASNGGSRMTMSDKLDFWTKYFEWPLHKFSDWLGVRVADRVICVSSGVRDEAVEFYGADPEKLAVVENGVNTTLFTPRFEGARPNLTRHSEGAVATEESPSVGSFAPPTGAQDDNLDFGFDLLYVGALRPRKNTHLLLEAFKFLPDDYRLTIVGRGNKEYEDRLHHLVKELKIESRVEFKGYIEYPRLPEVYQQAGLFVLPSKYEGMPKVVLEALACGVPVLASGFEMQNPIGGLEFVENLDPESLAERIQQMPDSDIKVDISAIREQYSWEEKVAEIEQVYKGLVK